MNKGQLHPAWLTRLEREAAERLDGKMLGFSGGEYACPWLRWYLRHKIFIREEVDRFLPGKAGDIRFEDKPRKNRGAT